MSDDLGPWPEKVYLLHPSIKSFGDMVTNPERREYVLADRSEELVKENYQLSTSLEMCHVAWDQALDQCNKVEAKLAKSVEALRVSLEGLNWAKAYLSTSGIDSVTVNHADATVYATLAELEKQ
jgi:hypothetical protein